MDDPNDSDDSQSLGKELEELLQESLTCFSNKEYENSIDVLLKAINICKKLNYEEKFADLHRAVAKSYFLLGNYTKGREYIKQAIDMHRKIENFSSLAKDFEVLADSDRDLQLFSSAVSFYEKVLEYKSKAQISTGIADVLIKTATCYVYLEEFEQSYEKFSLAEKLVEEWDRTSETMRLHASIYQGLGICASKLQKHEMALTHLDHALNLYDSLEDPDNIVLLLKLIGDQYYNSENKNKAIPYYQECVQVYEEKKCQEDATLDFLGALYNLAELYIDDEHYEQAIIVSEKGLKKSQLVKEEAWQLHFHLQQCICFIQTKQYRSAREILKSPIVAKLIEIHGDEEEKELFNTLIDLNDEAIGRELN